MISAKDLVNFIGKAGQLKKTYRFEASKEIKGDSAAEHSWQVAFMAFLIAKEYDLKLDMEKALEIALVHDLGEFIIGDIAAINVKKGVISKSDKNELEEYAFDEIKKALPDVIGKKVTELWEEYEKAETMEARFIKAVDKLETMIYLDEAGDYSIEDLDLAATYADEAVRKIPQLLEILKEVKLRIKNKAERAGLEWKEKYNYSLE